MREHDIGVALLGTGFMARVHIEALRRVGVRLIGILGSTPEKSAEAARRWDLPRAYRDLTQCLADPEVNAVHVMTPNRWHLPMVRAALEAGKHTLCEKPLAMNVAEAAEMTGLAARFPELATAVNYNNRYYALNREARDAVRRGDVGRIFHITGSVTQDWLLYHTDYNWRVLREEQGELRALADIGAHWTDLIHSISGLEPEAVCADFATVHPKRRRPRGETETFAGARNDPGATETEEIAIETDDYGAVLIRFRGGARGCFFVSQVSPGRKYRVAYEIAGQNRTLAWNSERCEEFWIGSRDEASRTLLRDPAIMSPMACDASDYPAGHAEGYPDSFKMCFRDFYRAIVSGDLSAPAYPTFVDGLRDMRLTAAIARSMRTGGWAAIEEDGQ
jgi:predicted dehydrogenase